MTDPFEKLEKGTFQIHNLELVAETERNLFRRSQSTEI